MLSGKIIYTIYESSFQRMIKSVGERQKRINYDNDV